MFSCDYCSEQYRNSCFSSGGRETGKDKQAVEYVAVGHYIREALQTE